jgi:hypothetical protein
MVCLVLFLGLTGLSEAALVGFQAESGALGADFDPPIIDSGALGSRYITIETGSGGEGPNHKDRVATYTVTFPDANTYDLYARLYTPSTPQSQADNDSMFYGNGFGTKDVGANADWIKVNGLNEGTGAGYPPDEWFWINLSEQRGHYGEDGITFTVLAGDLTQMLQIGAREDGLRIDAFVFGTATETFTDEQLDAAVPKATKAFGPVPADGSAYPATNPVLSWQPGANAADVNGHKIYFDPCEANVQARSGCDVNGVSRTEPNYPISGLVPGTWYYWAVDEVNGPDIWPGDVWSFEVQSLTAYNPDPYDGEISIGTDVVLVWSPGISAVSHKVYLDKVKSKIDARSGCLVNGKSTADPNYYPGPLELNTTYYWAIDEVGGPPDNTIYTGQVWSFTTMPDIPITYPNLVGWWTFDEGGGRTALDWSGHGNHGAIQGNPVWVTGFDNDGNALDFDGLGDYVNCGNAAIFNITEQITIAAWIKLEKFEQEWQSIVTKGEDGWRIVMNKRQDQILFGCGDVAELAGTRSVNDGEWHHVLGLYDGSKIYVYVDGLVDASQTATGTINTNDLNVLIGETERPGEGPRQWNGLIDDVRIYDKALTPEEIERVMLGDPRLAWKPSPANGSTLDVEHITSLSWVPGEDAAQHDVYFGTDLAAVADANEFDTMGIYQGRQLETTYTPTEALQWGQTYYWRIDEYNTDATITQGRIWTFTVADYLTVDDFEFYNDLETTDPNSNRIYNTWLDYYVNNTGATVGYLWETALPQGQHFAETIIVNSGTQSMPLFYDNDGTVNEGTKYEKTGTDYYSETECTFDHVQDWTRENVKSLALWFRGYPATKGSYTPNAGTFTVKADGADIGGTADAFHFVYKKMTGDMVYIEAKVESIGSSDADAKAGVMIRDSLEADSTNAFLCLTQDGRISFQARTVYRGSTEDATSDANTINLPYSVRLERELGGNTFYASYFDGIEWVRLPTEDYNSEFLNPQGVTMTDPVYIGLAYTSSITGTFSQAVFSNVKINDVPFQPTGSRDVPSNDAAPLYVAVEDSSNPPKIKVINHPDPNAVQLDEWTEWPIDLQDVNEAGVDLKNIAKIYIGVGDRDNPVSGGFGKLYIDDIRLYPSRCVLSMRSSDFAKVDYAPAGNPAGDCVVDYQELELMADDWLFGTVPSTADEIWLEAESANTMSPPMQVWLDRADAIGGRYIAVEPGNNSLDNPPAEGVATYVFAVKGGTYKILVRVIAPSVDDDSFWFNIPGATTQTANHSSGWVKMDVAEGSTWHWDEVNSDDDGDQTVQFTMGAGTYTLYIAYREDGTLLDRLLITDDLTLNQANLPPRVADMNIDDRIDLEDFAIVAEQWLNEQLWP